MAKQDNINVRIQNLEKESQLLKQLKSDLEQLNKIQGNLTIEQEKRKTYIQNEIKLLEGVDKKLQNLKKQQREQNKLIQESLSNYEELEDSLESIGNLVGKNTKAYDLSNEKLEKTKAIIAGIGSIAVNNSKINAEDAKNLSKYADAYKRNTASIIEANRLRALGRVNAEEEAQMIERAHQEYQDFTSTIKFSAKAAEEVKDMISAMNTETKSFGNAAKKSLSTIQNMDQAFGSFSGIPVMGEMNTLLKTNIKDSLAFKAALFAVGAAASKALYDYFGALDKIQRAAPYEAEKAALEGQIQMREALIPVQNQSLRIGKIQAQQAKEIADAEMQIFQARWEAQNAGTKAAVAFNAEIQQAALSFRTASKTALFGNKLGGVGYGAAQLQMAGISADKIAGAMSSAAAATGKMPTGKAAADMAIMAERTGTSVDDIAQITEHFQRIDGMSAEMSMNMAEGMRSMADKAGISLGNLMKEVAEASKDALGYQIKSGPALAKQVAFAQSLGVSFGDIAKAGKSMVLNYKDSIKAEMQLSSLLGEQVDLSEVRAKFAEGDTQGALKALQAQGLNPEDMDMFQQEALSQALGGMDLQSLSKIAKGKGTEVGDLKGASAAAGNKGFLDRTMAAQKEQAVGSAQISANQAVIDAKTSKEILENYFKQISDVTSPMGKEYFAIQQAQAAADAKEAKVAAEQRAAIIMDPGIQQLNARISQVDQQLNLFQSAVEGAIMALGGFATQSVGGTIMDKLGDKLGDKLLSKFGPKAGPKAPSAAVKTAAQIKAANPGMTSAQALQQAKSASSTATAAKSGGGIFGKIGSFGSKLLGGGGGGGALKILGGASKLAKGIPILGNLMSVGSAISNVMGGNYASAGLDLLGAIPGIGTAVNVARATGLTSGLEEKLNQGAKGLISGGDKKTTAAAPAATAKAAAPAASVATQAATQAASITAPTTDKMISILTEIKNNDDKRGILMYQKQIDQNGNLQRIVDRTTQAATTSMNLLLETKVMNTNTKAILDLTKRIEALTLATYSGKTEVKVDGKTIATAVSNYNSNTKGQKP